MFLDFWDPLAKDLRAFYEGLALRRETRCLAIFGVQGSGKTLFARKLLSDFQLAQEQAAKTGQIQPDERNLWHRMTGGGHFAADLVARATLNTDILQLEDNAKWVEEAKLWKQSRPSRHCIIVADNAERSYFRQSLLGLSDADYISLGDTPAAARKAAEKFVALARRELRGCLFVILTNDNSFLGPFAEAVEAQHSGLQKVTTIPQPGSRDK